MKIIIERIALPPNNSMELQAECVMSLAKRRARATPHSPCSSCMDVRRHWKLVLCFRAAGLS